MSHAKIVLRGALFLSGVVFSVATANRSAPRVRPLSNIAGCDCPAVFCNPTTRAWWTGKDSNLRSPQGAADLQSAGFSHSPTRPVNPFGMQKPRPVKTFWDANRESRTCSSTTCRHPPQKHKKDSCQETPARSFFLSGFAPPSLPRKISWWSWRRELNPRPSDYKSDALPAELRQRRSIRLRIAEGESELQGVLSNF